MPAGVLVDFGTQAQCACRSVSGIRLAGGGIPVNEVRPNQHQLTLAEVVAVLNGIGNGLCTKYADVTERAQLLANCCQCCGHRLIVMARDAQNTRFHAQLRLCREQGFHTGVTAVGVRAADNIGRSYRFVFTFFNANDHGDRFALIGDSQQRWPRVPVLPALPLAASTSVISTGVLRGNRVASASFAVHTMPIMAVETVEITRVPSLISITRTPW